MDPIKLFVLSCALAFASGVLVLRWDNRHDSTLKEKTADDIVVIAFIAGLFALYTPILLGTIHVLGL